MLFLVEAFTSVWPESRMNGLLATAAASARPQPAPQVSVISAVSRQAPLLPAAGTGTVTPCLVLPFFKLPVVYH